MDNPYAAHLRATDLDRTEIASLIDRAYAEGQLNSLEHDERVSAAMTAATRGDLLELIKDLQVEDPEFSAPEKKANPLIPSQKPTTGLIVVIVAVVTLVVVAAVVMLVGRSGSDSPAPAPAPTTPTAPAAIEPPPELLRISRRRPSPRSPVPCLPRTPAVPVRLPATPPPRSRSTRWRLRSAATTSTTGATSPST